MENNFKQGQIVYCIERDIEQRPNNIATKVCVCEYKNWVLTCDVYSLALDEEIQLHAIFDDIYTNNLFGINRWNFNVFHKEDVYIYYPQALQAIKKETDMIENFNSSCNKEITVAYNDPEDKSNDK